MSKIFISHATPDADLAEKLMDFLQGQYDLKRDDFFMSSDEEFQGGDDWISIIQTEMQNAKIILPVITPDFLESHFCLCELGAAWINKKSLLPVTLHPENQQALDRTPYRATVQVIPLNSVDNIARIGESFAAKGEFPRPNMVRFTKRAETLYENTITEHSERIKNRKEFTEEEVNSLRLDLEEAKLAYEEADDKVLELEKEVTEIRKLKNAEDLKAYDYEQLDEWEELEEALSVARNELRKCSNVLPTVIFYNYSGSDHGFYPPLEVKGELRTEEFAGRIKFDEGYVIDEEDPIIFKVISALDELKKLMIKLEDNTNLLNKFYDEYENVRFSLRYTPFWEKVLHVTIYNRDN